LLLHLRSFLHMESSKLTTTMTSESTARNSTRADFVERADDEHSEDKTENKRHCDAAAAAAESAASRCSSARSNSLRRSSCLLLGTVFIALMLDGMLWTVVGECVGKIRSLSRYFVSARVHGSGDRYNVSASAELRTVADGTRNEPFVELYYYCTQAFEFSLSEHMRLLPLHRNLSRSVHWQHCMTGVSHALERCNACTCCVSTGLLCRTEDSR
jgi:hypothetical protein